MGKDYKAIQEKYLHTAGNLTLTGYNSELRDKSFKEKRDGQGGFRQSPLRLNEGLRNVETWNEQAILKRAKDLADLSAKIWLSPTLPEEVLNEYKDRKNKNKQNQYNLSDYNFNSKTKELFEILDKEILALNENIERKPNKRYILYKFYKSLVHIIPLQNELRLTLNINISELHDAKSIARDISNIGSLGNGDVDFYIKNKEEIPYCIGLIHQALNKQLD